MLDKISSWLVTSVISVAGNCLFTYFRLCVRRCCTESCIREECVLFNRDTNGYSVDLFASFVYWGNNQG